MKRSVLGIEAQHLGQRILIDLPGYRRTSVAMVEKHDVKRVDYVPTLGAPAPPSPAAQVKAANPGGTVRGSRQKPQGEKGVPDGI